jgi:hypothetical protein
MLRAPIVGAFCERRCIPSRQLLYGRPYFAKRLVQPDIPDCGFWYNLLEISQRHSDLSALKNQKNSVPAA